MKLKAYVQYDGSGRVVPGGPIFRSSKPKVGNWKEINANQCCNPISYNFDITAEWNLTTPEVVDAASFKTFLESGTDGSGNSSGFSNVVITDFNLVDGRLRCNLSATGQEFRLSDTEVTQALKFGQIEGLTEIYLVNNSITNFDPPSALPDGLSTLDLTNNLISDFNPTLPLPSTLFELYLADNDIVTFNPSQLLPNSIGTIDLYGNQIVTFDPSLPLPSSLFQIYLDNNLIVTFDPSLALPSSLEFLGLSNNSIVTFNPSIPLPESLSGLNLSNNEMTTAGYAASEPWANGMHDAPVENGIEFWGNLDSVAGTNLETILVGKGWNVIAV